MPAWGARLGDGDRVTTRDAFRTAVPNCQSDGPSGQATEERKAILVRTNRSGGTRPRAPVAFRQPFRWPFATTTAQREITMTAALPASNRSLRPRRIRQLLHRQHLYQQSRPERLRPDRHPEGAGPARGGCGRARARHDPAHPGADLPDPDPGAWRALSGLSPTVGRRCVRDFVLIRTTPERELIHDDQSEEHRARHAGPSD